MNYIFLKCLQESEKNRSQPLRSSSGDFPNGPGHDIAQKYFLIPPASDASFHSSNREDAGVAQLVEHFLAKEDVARSSRVTRSILRGIHHRGVAWRPRTNSKDAVSARLEREHFPRLKANVSEAPSFASSEPCEVGRLIRPN
jgi:hypothetical protein